MLCNMIILYFRLPYFNVSNSALFSTYDFSTLILYLHFLFYTTISSKTNTQNKLIYRNDNQSHPVWYRKRNDQISLERPYQCLRATKLQFLQFKIVHRIINCNKNFFVMKLKELLMCPYCDEIDDIPHFFVHCDNVSDIWKYFLFSGTKLVISLWTSQRTTVKNIF